MSVHQTLLCCFLLSLQVGTVDALNHYYREPGEKLSIRCGFSRLYGSQKIFCRENCEGENLLISTSQKTAQRGRYGTEYKEDGLKDFYQGSPVLIVSVSHLTQSDSGLYRCGLGDSSSTTQYVQFRVLVADAVLKETKVHFSKTAGSSLTVGCFFGHHGNRQFLCRGRCDEDVLIQTDKVRAENGRYRIEYEKRAAGSVVFVTIDQLIQADSGSYRCSLDLTNQAFYRDFTVSVTDASPTTTQRSGSSSPSVSSDQENTGTFGGTSGGTSNHTSDLLLIVALTVTFILLLLLSVALLIFCRRRSAKHQQAPAVQTDYSPAAEAQDDSSKLTYSEVNFSSRSSDSPLRSSAGNTDVVVVYSDIRVGRAAEEPLYSNTA
ncbi:polymeric immunoglobulin receptor-like isoform X1 [Kryptolebias marmoratus]|uniref:polymeric immunoglobulin receptor-like isoform X1 n=1 Tax=Kryptolebias marmoratus TaxID=37003 RepID=UPI000D530053|nr:polymeric immunoglobulin receptor-like isoform X1 [Kryptolebias marmoratus]